MAHAIPTEVHRKPVILQYLGQVLSSLISGDFLKLLILEVLKNLLRSCDTTSRGAYLWIS